LIWPKRFKITISWYAVNFSNLLKHKGGVVIEYTSFESISFFLRVCTPVSHLMNCFNFIILFLKFIKRNFRKWINRLFNAHHYIENYVKAFMTWMNKRSCLRFDFVSLCSSCLKFWNICLMYSFLIWISFCINLIKCLCDFDFEQSSKCCNFVVKFVQNVETIAYSLFMRNIVPDKSS